MNAGKRLAEFHKQDDEYLEWLQDCKSMQGYFGISRVQRMMRIGYNRAAILVDRAIDKGILIRDTEDKWFVKFNTEGK